MQQPSTTVRITAPDAVGIAHDLVDAVRDPDRVEVVERPEDRHFVDPLAPRRGPIVEQPDRQQAELRVPAHLADDEGPGVAGPPDQDPARAGGMALTRR